MLPLCDVIPSRKTPLATIGLLAVNTLVFAYGLLDAGGMPRALPGAGSTPSAVDWARLLTGGFLHDGWIPFSASMLSLWIFGDNVEDAMGHGAFLLFYISAAALGTLAHAALHPESVPALAGGSSAVAAVMGAYFALYPRSRILTAILPAPSIDLVEVPAVYLLAAWFGLQALSGVTSAGPDAGGLGLAGHLTGFAAGAAVGIGLRRLHRWE